MNICIITSTFPTNEQDPFGGFILDFCRVLSKDHSVTVVTQKRCEEYRIPDYIKLVPVLWEGNEIPLAELKFHKPSHVFYTINLLRNAAKTLTHLAQKTPIDRCFCLWALPSGLGGYFLFKKFNIPYDVWCLGSDIWKHKGNPLTRPFLNKILNRAKNVYTDGYHFCKEVDFICNKTSMFLPSCRIIPRILINPKIGKPVKTTFLFIGRYHHNKGPDILIQAIRKLPEEINSNSDFEFHGTGPLKQSIMDQAEKLNLKNVYFNDVICTDRIYEVFHHAHFLIIPSRFDSIPVILSDALQCDTPVIGSDIGDLGTVIKKYGIGYTFKKENIEQLCVCIVKAFKDDKNDYCKNCKEAAKIFSVDYAVNEFLKNI
jgi:glycosyltransferase involved in cell wall biosynthesis